MPNSENEQIKSFKSWCKNILWPWLKDVGSSLSPFLTHAIQTIAIFAFALLFGWLAHHVPASSAELLHTIDNGLIACAALVFGCGALFDIAVPKYLKFREHLSLNNIDSLKRRIQALTKQIHDLEVSLSQHQDNAAQAEARVTVLDAQEKVLRRLGLPSCEADDQASVVILHSPSNEKQPLGVTPHVISLVPDEGRNALEANKQDFGELAENSASPIHHNNGHADTTPTNFQYPTVNRENPEDSVQLERGQQSQ
jgi:hypothetical protein